MELMELSLSINSKKVTLVIIYRPESSDTNTYTMETFFEEFNELMAYYHLIKNEVIITGDFNIHVNKPTLSTTKKLNEILDTFGLIQHIEEPTHKYGNTLDLLITRKNTAMKEFVVDEQLSDHNNIIFKLNFNKPPPNKKT